MFSFFFSSNQTHLIKNQRKNLQGSSCAGYVVQRSWAGVRLVTQWWWHDGGVEREREQIKALETRDISKFSFGFCDPQLGLTTVGFAGLRY